MRQLAIALSLGAWLALGVACASGDGPASPRRDDAGAVDGGSHTAAALPTVPKGPVDEADAGAAVSGEIDLNSLLIAELIETESSLVARCPCLIASGMYASASECMAAVGLGRKWVDCASSLDLSAHDDPQTRATLRCNIQELKQRGQCLMGSGCSADAIGACMTATLSCDRPPVELLSQFAVECQIAFSR